MLYKPINILYKQTQRKKAKQVNQQMSQRTILKSPLSNQRSISKGKSSINPSPQSKQRDLYGILPQDSSLTPPKNNYLAQILTSTQNVLKTIQQPLQFSGNKKSKIKPNNMYSNGCNGLNIFSTSTYTINNNKQVSNQINKLSNENQVYDVNKYGYQIKNEQNDIQKLRNYYENEIKIFIQNKKIIQNENEQKIKNMQKQKNYWRQSYMKLKQQYQQYIKNNEQKQNEKNKIKQKFKNNNFQQYNYTINKSNSQKNYNFNHLQDNINILQQQLLQNQKSNKIMEDQIYSLKKDKAELEYQINHQKQQNKRNVTKMFDLQQQFNKKQNQIKQLKDKIDRIQKKCQSLSYSRNCVQSQIKPAPQRHHSNSGTRSKTSSSSPNPISIPSDTKSNSNNNSTPPNTNTNKNRRHSGTHIIHESPPIHPIHVNLDYGKQIQKLKHSYRRLQKCLVSQNNQTMVQGLKRLNEKYIGQDMDNSSHSSQYSRNSRNMYESKYESKLYQSNIFRLGSGSGDSTKTSNAFQSKISKYW